MKFSVVIPVYNGEETIDECLHYLNQQNTLLHFEVIVVNDGSTDDTEIVLQNWQKKSNKKFVLKIITQENKKAGIARNTGVKTAKGDIILFIGDDIFVSPEWLQAHANFHKKHKKKLDVAVGNITWTPQLTKSRFRMWLQDSGLMPTFKGIKDMQKSDYWHFYTGNISLKKEALLEFPFKEEFSCYGWEDILLGYEILGSGGNLFYLENAFVYHHHRLSQRDFFPHRMREIGAAARVFSNFYPNIPLVPYGIKKIIFHLLALKPIIFVLSKFSKELGWYAQSKRHFLEGFLGL